MLHYLQNSDINKLLEWCIAKLTLALKVYFKVRQQKFGLIAIFILSGTIAGLSAPGIHFGALDFANNIWFALTPFILLLFTGFWQALGLGLIYGLIYNLIYLNWFLGLSPLDWLSGIDKYWIDLIPIIAWFFEVIHQSLILVIALMIAKVGFNLTRQIKLFNLLAVPLIITVVMSYLNQYKLSGVGWTSFEYTQYHNPVIIEPCYFFGDKALTLLILMVNTAFAFLVNDLYRQFGNNKNNFQIKLFKPDLKIVLTAFIIFICWFGCGLIIFSLPENNINTQKIKVALIQPNITVEERYQHQLSFAQILQKNVCLLNQCHDELVILPENATPTNLIGNIGAVVTYKFLCWKNRLKILTGAMYKNSTVNKIYNSAYGINDLGLNKEIYHKRYLVPFGEFNPAWVKLLPQELQEITCTPAGSEFSFGDKSISLTIGKIKINVLICFEVLYPELSKDFQSTNSPIIVNLSDLSWFHNSIIGEQMIAFATFRSVENHKYVLFVANTGPSSIISPKGINLAKTLSGQKVILEKELTLNTN